ncbi:glycosyltransferase family 2 protein [Methanospirillum sp.]|jgi:glycosyltransferase involved in cell wall biosynthesis|uniref:glycosyltransferase n=1 Tax=Methanospirillum sp. TaxID=45200 RepID=UPI00359FB76B
MLKNKTTNQNNCDLNYIIYSCNSQVKGEISNSFSLPRVSFCIPTLNNEKTIECCIRSIVNQNYPDFEIIIVDGYSTDQTVKIAKKYTNLIFYDSGFLGSARQTGVEKATGEILALFDSDIIIPHKNWLRNAVPYFNIEQKISTIWPVNIAPPNSNLVTQLYFNYWKLIMDYRLEKGHGYFGGGNSLITKKSIEAIGGINRSLHWGEDYDWAKKLKDIGYKVVYLQDPLYHDTMSSILIFTKKQFTGAKTFTHTGFQFMGLSTFDIFYEQIIIGFKGMFKGIFIERNFSWIIYPLFVIIRGLAYGYTYLMNLLK